MRTAIIFFALYLLCGAFFLAIAVLAMPRRFQRENGSFRADLATAFLFLYSIALLFGLIRLLILPAHVISQYRFKHLKKVAKHGNSSDEFHNFNPQPQTRNETSITEITTQM
jgi:hypothetical protein